MLVFLVVMASLVASGRPALLAVETTTVQQIAVRPWTERLNVGRAHSRIGVLQRMTLTPPRVDAIICPTVPAIASIASERIHPLRCALPPPALDRV